MGEKTERSGGIHTITVNSMMYSHDSFSICGRGLSLGLQQNGQKIVINAWQDGSRTIPMLPELIPAIRRASDFDIGIQISHPDSFQNLRDFHTKIGFGVCETQTIKKMWVVNCNKNCDQVWTPSNFCTKIFVDNGIKNCYTVPNGFDERFFNRDIPPYQYPFDEDTFIFLTVGNSQERKGTRILYEAFSEEFKENEKVALVFKSYAHWAWGAVQYARNGISDELAAKYNVSLAKDPRVYMFGNVEERFNEKENKYELHLVDPEIPFDKMGSLYTGADCFVLPTRGEGFGMPALEAKACGIPVIITKSSGHMDFCRRHDTFLLNYEGKSKAFEGYNWQGEWVNPSKEHLKELMRYVYENEDDRKRRAKKSYNFVHKNFTWKKVGERALECLKIRE
jgi:hypothetical protein